MKNITVTVDDETYRNARVKAAAMGCSTLYTEELAHGRRIESVVIISPFR